MGGNSIKKVFEEDFKQELPCDEILIRKMLVKDEEPTDPDYGEDPRKRELGEYIRKGVKINPYIHGGAQEKSRRAGTENVANVVGLAKAMEIAYENIDEHNERLINLRNKLIDKIKSNISHVKLNGHPEKRLPGNANVSVEFIEGEALLLSLDMVGISGSSGSACTSGSLDPSHVLLAIGLPHEIAHGSLRLSLGDFNTEEEIDYVVENLIKIVERLRLMSPLYEQVKEEK